MNCDFCKKTFSTKYTLVYHTKTSKKCLSIQQNQSESIEIQLQNCEFCKKTYSIQNLRSHLLTCQEKKKNDLAKEKENYESNIQKLQNEIIDLKTENTQLKTEIIELKSENTELRTEIKYIKKIMKPSLPLLNSQKIIQ